MAQMAGALATICGLALLAAVSVLVPAVLRISGRALFVLAGFVTAAATIVGTAIALSVVDWLTRVGWLAGEAVVAAAALTAWWLGGRPSPPRGWRPSRAGLRSFAATEPVAAAAAGLATVAAAVQFVVGLLVAPNNWDSMAYHLSRAAYWLEHDSARHFAGGTLRQLDSAPNGELLQAWTMSLTGTDRYVELVQWACLLALGVAVFAGARMLAFGPGPAVFAGALFMLLPQPLMQAASTQNDLVVALFVATAALFAVRGLRDRSPAELAVAGAALGLAVGTKGTVFFAGLGVVVLVVGALVAYRPPRRIVLIGALAAVVGVAVLGAFNYVLNQQSTGNALGRVEDQTRIPAGENVARNAVRVGWTFFDSPGVSVPALDLLSARVARILPHETRDGLDTNLGPAVQEDVSAFGLIGWLVLPCVLLFALLRWRGHTASRLLAGASILVLVVMMARLAYNPWWGRILIPMVALGAPLLATVAKRRTLGVLVLALAVPNALAAVLINSGKPLLVAPDSKSVLALDRLSQQTLPRPDVLTTVKGVFARIGPHDAIGFVGGDDSWDYPYFGAHLNHRVVRFDFPQQVSAEAMKRYGLAGVVFVDEALPPSSVATVQLSPNGYWAPARASP
jgi:hypothetical protein